MEFRGHLILGINWNSDVSVRSIQKVSGFRLSYWAIKTKCLRRSSLSELRNTLIINKNNLWNLDRLP